MSHTSSDSSLDSKINTSELQKRYSNTTTDMMVNMIANSDKLISTDRRYNFNHNDKTESHHHDNNIAHPSSLHNSDKKEDMPHNNTERPFEKTVFEHASNQSQTKDNDISKNELVLEKLNMIRKLGELSQQGIKLSQKYTINSELSIMEYEYELHRKIRAKKEMIKWMGSGMLLLVRGMELLSGRYNPFDIQLKGWHDQMNAEVGDYVDVFGQIYEQYFGKSGGRDLPPLVKLVGMVFFSAFMFHMANKATEYITGKNQEDDPLLLAELRQQAMNKNIDQQHKNNSKIDKAMEFEHNLAAQKAADINYLKNKELEFIREQQKNIENMAKQAKLDALKQKLNKQRQESSSSSCSESLNKTEQPIMRAPIISNSIKNIFAGTPLTQTKPTYASGLFASTVEKIRAQSESSSISTMNTTSSSSSSKSSRSGVSKANLTLTANLDSILKSDARPKNNTQRSVSSSMSEDDVVSEKKKRVQKKVLAEDIDNEKGSAKRKPKRAAKRVATTKNTKHTISI